MIKKEWRCWGCHSAGEVVGAVIDCKQAGTTVEPPLVANHPRFDSCPYRRVNPLGRSVLSGEGLKELHAYAVGLRKRGVATADRMAQTAVFEKQLK